VKTMNTQRHSQTMRQKIFLLLGEKEMTAREISQAIGIREREVYDHLPHVSRSASAQKRKLVVLVLRVRVRGTKALHTTQPMPPLQEDTC